LFYVKAQRKPANKGMNKLDLLKKALLSLSIVTAMPIAATTNYSNDLPELGTVASSSLTIEKEVRIGKAYMMQLRGQLPIIYDPLIDEYINDVGLSLVAQADDVKTQFEFFMVENNTINAFAFFGGNVGVHTGLLLLTDNESELASVLGHEITHVTQRHLARSMEQRDKTNPATIAAVLASIALAVAGAGEAGMAGLQTSLALSQQMSINYTRSNEKEADRIGIKLLAKSNYDPYMAPTFFSKMASQYRYSTKMPPMLMSHPVTESRIAETRIRAQQYDRPVLNENLNYHLAKARVSVRFNNLDIESKEAQIVHNKTVLSPVRTQARQYTKALVKFELKQYAEAFDIIEQLRHTDPNNLFYIDTLSDIYLATERPNEAIKLLAQYIEIMPNNQVVALNYASALLESKQFDTASNVLERYIQSDPSNISAWGLKQQVHQQAKQPIDRYIAKAEISALYGNFKGALKDYYQAHNLIKDDEITQARIEARIKELRFRRDNLKNLTI